MDGGQELEIPLLSSRREQSILDLDPIVYSGGNVNHEVYLTAPPPLTTCGEYT
jgi:hypothetical protein